MTVPMENESKEVQSRRTITRVFVVLNPVAGTTNADTTRQSITDFCTEHNWQCDIHETKKDEDLRQLIQEMIKKGVDLVIVSGGDGTVAEVVSGLVNSEIPMAILPGGTGNSLARDLTIPVNTGKALALLDGEQKIQSLDVMRVNAKNIYVMNVSVGVSSVIMQKTSREQKRRFGFLAYLWHTFGSFLHSDMHRFEVLVDGKEVRFSATEVMIANHKFMGLQPQIEGVEIDPNDGRLDMFIARTKSLPDFLDIASSFALRRKRYGDPNLHYLSAHETIFIKTHYPLPAQADGEEIGSTPLEIRLIPHALHIVVPPETIKKE